MSDNGTESVPSRRRSGRVQRLGELALFGTVTAVLVPYLLLLCTASWYSGRRHRRVARSDTPAETPLSPANEAPARRR